MKKKALAATIDRDDLLPEYRFDYRKARRNRFAPPGEAVTRSVVLDPEVAEVFPESDSVNAVLRPLAQVLRLVPGRISPAMRRRQEVARRYQDAVRRAQSATDPAEKKIAWQEAEERGREWLEFLKETTSTTKRAQKMPGNSKKKV